jgi:hypothetical protein
MLRASVAVGVQPVTSLANEINRLPNPAGSVAVAFPAIRPPSELIEA